ncbi:protein usf-like isoform X2 [Littorina saxatilis]|uniref:protein usf-like isoform X2 n=1 Tax=Littorina saxatilis TaxID=31220 RepID=UPI0038B67830
MRKCFSITTATMSKISVPSDNAAGPVPAVLFGDPSKTKRGVVVLQEWWGLNQQIQDEAKQIAEEGTFVTIVPDLYRGKLATDNEAAGHLMGNLDWPGAVKDIEGCVRYLKEKGCKKVGVTGFCMGGALSLASAALVKEVDAAAPFYGIPGADLADVSKIKVPVQCHFGDSDEVAGFSDPPSQKALQEKLKAGKVNFEFFSYPGCKHAFTNSTSANFNKDAFTLALKRVVEFFQKNL